MVVHELGHYLAAKHVGVRVEQFSIGFGPKLFSIKKGETEYQLCAIPLGGYVKMAGEDPSEKMTGQKWEFMSRSAFDRFKIIFSGAALNYILAFVLFSVIFMFGRPSTEVGAIMDGYPAKSGGIMVGDKIISVDGKNVKFWEDMTEIIYKHVKGDIIFTVERNGQAITKEITPVLRKTKDIFGKPVEIALVGIAPSSKLEKERNNFFASMKLGFRKLMSLTAITYKALFLMVLGRMPMREMTGPLGIFVITGQVAREGIVPLLNLLGVISASLAIFNLLPFPVLDGGHILFLAIEKIRGKPMSLKTQENIAKVGWGFLITLMIFILYNDMMKFGIADKIMKIFTK